MKFFLPFTKIEKRKDGTLLVAGRMTDETVDLMGDVLTYEGTKKAVTSWRGNVREQHDVHKAVGRRLNIDFKDGDNAVDVETLISSGSQDTQAKILEGVLTGFSVGGDPPTKWRMEKRDGKEVRIVEEWTMRELSVVDAPANPNANIYLVKADGGATDALANDPDETAPAPVAPPVENRFATALVSALQKARAEEPVKKADAPAGEPDDMGAVSACKTCKTSHSEAGACPGGEKCDKCDASHHSEGKCQKEEGVEAAAKAPMQKGLVKITKHYGGGEELDIADALAILERLKMLQSAEAAEGENESTCLAELNVAVAAVKRFIQIEAGELVAGPEPVAAAAAATFTKALEARDADITKAFGLIPDLIRKSVTDSIQTLRAEVLDGVRDEVTKSSNNAEQLAEAVGTGLSKATDPILKALGDLKALPGEVKAMSERFEKFAKAPVPVKPIVRVAPGGAQNPATAGRGTNRAAILREYSIGAPPEAAAFLRQMANAAEAEGK